MFLTDILVHKKDNHLYLVFQDFEHKIDDIYNAIDTFPPKSRKSIKKILNVNFFSNTLDRQKNFVNSITTYIDDILDNQKQYYFHLYILPKDLKIEYCVSDTKDELINKIELLSITLFKEYSKLNVNTKYFKLYDNFEGKNFLQLEANFYIKKLETLYSNMINYKSNHQKKIICSDKIIGIEINDLNLIENNPLKNYQFIHTPYQHDLIRFIYSIMKFLKKYRLQIFENTCPFEYEVLIRLINKINNLLLKISPKKFISQDMISKDTLITYLKIFKNKKELKQNRKIYNIITSIFFTKIEKNIQLFLSINLTEMFEKLIEKRLKNYNTSLFIGDEKKKKIVSYPDNKFDANLNNINHLLKNDENKINQYPDFLIKDTISNMTIYHIVDAKYKLRDNIFNSSDMRQLLLYSILFNKDYSINLSNQKNIKKIIIYADKSQINLDMIDTIELNTSIINIDSEDNSEIYEDNIFDSLIRFISIKIFK